LNGPERTASDAKWHVSVGFLTDTGLVRDRNEDSYAVHLPYAGEASRTPADAFFAVADGMGGHNAGDYASQYVAGAAQNSFAERGQAISDVSGWLERMIRRVNRELTSIAKREFNARGMGSTLTIAVLQSGRVYLGHVGDSRAYRLFGGELEQLTPDHSWVGEQVRSGLLTPEQAAVHPKRNLLTQCLGIDPDVKPYLADEPLQDGSRYLLCSDGLFGLVPDSVLRRILLDEREPQSAAARLIAIANEAGGGDNITAVVFDVLEASELATTIPIADPADTVRIETAVVERSLSETASAPSETASPLATTSSSLATTASSLATTSSSLATTASSSLSATAPSETETSESPEETGAVRGRLPRLLTIVGLLLLVIAAGVAAREILSAGEDAASPVTDTVAVPTFPVPAPGDDDQPVLEPTEGSQPMEAPDPAEGPGSTGDPETTGGSEPDPS